MCKKLMVITWITLGKNKSLIVFVICANDLSETRNNDYVGFYCENDIFNFQIRVDMTMHPFSLLTIVWKDLKF